MCVTTLLLLIILFGKYRTTIFYGCCCCSFSLLLNVLGQHFLFSGFADSVRGSVTIFTVVKLDVYLNKIQKLLNCMKMRKANKEMHIYSDYVFYNISNYFQRINNKMTFFTSIGKAHKYMFQEFTSNIHYLHMKFRMVISFWPSQNA